jgi:hypothetical protein
MGALPFRFTGMSQREWLEGMVLQGLASRLTDERFGDLMHGIVGGRHEANVARTLADAMLQARKKEEDND